MRATKWYIELEGTFKLVSDQMEQILVVFKNWEKNIGRKANKRFYDIFCHNTIARCLNYLNNFKLKSIDFDNMIKGLGIVWKPAELIDFKEAKLEYELNKDDD